MPERRFDDGYWNDPYVMKLPMKAKLLYLYLWTNRHCNQAGLYEIALETIHFETGLEVAELAALLRVLEKKIVWYPEQNLMWVKNFLHRQGRSPQFLAAAAKCLAAVTNNNGLIKEYLEYNEGYTLSIPYQYPIDRVSIPSYAVSVAQAESGLGDKGVTKGVVKGKEKGGKGEGRGKPTRDSIVQQVFEDMRTYLGFPDRVLQDPIPSYGKEGQAIKRMLARGFTREEVTDRWKRKVDACGGEFTSMVWVNEDIGKSEGRPRRGKRLSTAAEIHASVVKATT